MSATTTRGVGPFRALGALFAMIFSFCTAGERLGKSLDHLAQIAEEEAEGLKEQMRVDRQRRILELANSTGQVIEIEHQKQEKAA